MVPFLSVRWVDYIERFTSSSCPAIYQGGTKYKNPDSGIRYRSNDSGAAEYPYILISASISPGVIDAGPLLHRHRVSNESISLTAQHPGGPTNDEYQCITDECFWIVNAICHRIWVYVYQTGERRTFMCTFRFFWQIKDASHHMSHLCHFLHILQIVWWTLLRVCEMLVCMCQKPWGY